MLHTFSNMLPGCVSFSPDRITSMFTLHVQAGDVATLGECDTCFFVMSNLRLVPSWHCDVVNGVKGCCRNGRDCGTDDGVCTTSGYVHCEGENFCCRKPFPLALRISPPALNLFGCFQRLVTIVTETPLVPPNVAADPGLAPAHEPPLQAVFPPLQDQPILQWAVSALPSY